MRHYLLIPMALGAIVGSAVIVYADLSGWSQDAQGSAAFGVILAATLLSALMRERLDGRAR